MDLKKEEQSKNVFYVGLLSFFGGISQDIFSPILPIYLTAVLGFDKTFVGTAEGIVTASATIFAVVAGYFSDKLRRQKPIVFAGYFLSMIARPLLALVTSGVGIVGLRLLDGIGKGIKGPPKDVLIASSSKKEIRGRSFGIARMLDTLGSVVGPLVLFALLHFFENNNYVYHYILLFASVPLLITLFVITFNIKEVLPHQKEEEKSSRKILVKLPKSFYIFLVICSIFTIGTSSDAFLILRAKEVGFLVNMLPVVIAVFNLVYAFSAVPFGILSDKIGRIPTLIIGWTLYVLTYIGFSYLFNPSMVWILYIIYGIYFGATLGVTNAFLADLVGWEYRGRAFGIFGMAMGVASFFASFIAGFLWDKFGPQMPFYFGASMAALATLLLISFSNKLKPVS
jgi:MFS family permease